MPFAKLTDQQIQAVLVAYEEIMKVPCVTMVEVDFTDRRRTEPGVVVYIDVHDRTGLGKLPTGVAGVPVIAKLENCRTGRVIETIDPRMTGGDWPHR